MQKGRQESQTQIYPEEVKNIKRNRKKIIKPQHQGKNE